MRTGASGQPGKVLGSDDEDARGSTRSPARAEIIRNRWQRPRLLAAVGSNQRGPPPLRKDDGSQLRGAHFVDGDGRRILRLNSLSPAQPPRGPSFSRPQPRRRSAPRRAQPCKCENACNWESETRRRVSGVGVDRNNLRTGPRSHERTSVMWRIADLSRTCGDFRVVPEAAASNRSKPQLSIR